MTYLILVKTPFRILRPLSWWKGIKRKLFKKNYDTVYYSQEIDGTIYIFKSTLFGFVKQIEHKDWKQSKYPSEIVQITQAKNKI